MTNTPSHLFTAEENNEMDTLSSEEYLADLKRQMQMMAADLLRRPGIPARDRRRILAALKRLGLHS